MHYVLGLERLGYETWYIEDGGANPYDPRANSVVMECAYNVDYVRRMMEAYGLGDRWAYWDAINDVYHGLSRERVRALYRESDALINLCGATRLRDEHMQCPMRIMIDTDPVYEQIKYAKADPAARAYLQAHTHFFTYGENIGAPDCPVPLSGIDWRGTRRRSFPISGRSTSANRNAFRPSRPGRTRARTSPSRAPNTSGRSMSTSCASSTFRGAAGAASRWRCCRRTPPSRQRSQVRAGSSPTRGRSRPG